MPLDKGTNEWDGDEGEDRDDHEPDYDSMNDIKWLEEHDEDPDDKHSCCRGDCK